MHAEKVDGNVAMQDGSDSLAMQDGSDSQKMSYVTIGSMRVSSVMCGTMMWGSFVDEEAEAHRQLDAYINAGGNFIDTAELYPVAFNYGRTTETWIGWWLRQRLAEGSIERGAIHIASKCNMAGVGGTPGG